MRYFIFRKNKWRNYVLATSKVKVITKIFSCVTLKIDFDKRSNKIKEKFYENQAKDITKYDHVPFGRV